MSAPTTTSLLAGLRATTGADQAERLRRAIWEAR